MHIHAVNLRCEQRRFVSARTCADLYNYILVIIRVFGQQQNLQLLLQRFHPLPVLVQGLLYHFPHLFVAFPVQQFQGVRDFLIAFLVFRVRVHDGSQIALFLHQLPEPLLVGGHRRLMELA